MADWQTIDELHDISADLPRFTKALTELATRLGLISRLWRQITFRCAAIRIPPPSAGVGALSSVVRCYLRTSLTVGLSACLSCTSL